MEAPRDANFRRGRNSLNCHLLRKEFWPVNLREQTRTNCTARESYQMFSRETLWYDWRAKIFYGRILLAALDWVRSHGIFVFSADLEMPDWLASLWEAFKVSGVAEVFKNPDGSWNWDRFGNVLKGAGGAVAVVAGGAFALYKFRAEQRKKADEKKGGATNVTHSGQGPASGWLASV